MNELRMYVEHLFEGRVLTQESIELKEEIYGNLVARYEDYIAGGMSEAEALEKTKASFTSIEDVFKESGEAEDSNAGEAASAQAGESGAASWNAGAVQAAPGADGMGSAAETAQMPRPEGAPVQPDGVGAEGQATAGTQAALKTRSPRKIWPFVVGGVLAAFILLAIVGTAVFGLIDEADVGEPSSTAQSITQNNSSTTDTNQGAENGQAGGTAGGGAAQNYDDLDDQREYEATKQVDEAIAAHSVDTLKNYTGNSLPDQGFFEHLPLSMYVSSTGAEQGSNASCSVQYAGVSDDIDGDAIDRALVYNAVAAFSVYPELQTVNFTVQKADDTAYDASVYSFNRNTLEHAFDNASGGAITQLNSSLYESQESWDQVRDYVTRNHFYDRQTDLAEIDD
ncbi:permease prefix domain 1-containing protein [Enorma massiliensis]|uniref:permease prefix domain 1-containing protein n=1 Tax=Enorma massiliensis TaxID=1472761 RepID=UPI003A934D0E